MTANRVQVHHVGQVQVVIDGPWVTVANGDQSVRLYVLEALAVADLLSTVTLRACSTHVVRESRKAFDRQEVKS